MALYDPFKELPTFKFVMNRWANNDRVIIFGWNITSVFLHGFLSITILLKYSHHFRLLNVGKMYTNPSYTKSNTDIILSKVFNTINNYLQVSACVKKRRMRRQQLSLRFLALRTVLLNSKHISTSSSCLMPLGAAALLWISSSPKTL